MSGRGKHSLQRGIKKMRGGGEFEDLGRPGAANRHRTRTKDALPLVTGGASMEVPRAASLRRDGWGAVKGTGGQNKITWRGLDQIHSRRKRHHLTK